MKHWLSQKGKQTKFDFAPELLERSGIVSFIYNKVITDVTESSCLQHMLIYEWRVHLDEDVVQISVEVDHIQSSR